MSLEIEAKLSVPDLRTPRHLSRYPLARRVEAGWALRLRRTAGGLLLGLKALASHRGAVHRREELEVELARDGPPSDWPAGRVRETVLRAAGGEPLTDWIFCYPNWAGTLPKSAGAGRSR